MMSDLLAYLRERVVERLVDESPEITEEQAQAWFDALFEQWFQAQGPAEADDVAGDEDATPVAESRSHIEIRFAEGTEPPGEVPVYDPPPLAGIHRTDIVQFWMRMAYQPWPDLPLERAARVFSQRLSYSVPQAPLTYERCQLTWARFSEAEARALVFELYHAGVNIEALLDQIEAFPYPDISLAWFIQPEHSLHMQTATLDQLRDELQEVDPVSLARLRHNAKFIARLAELISPHVRIWLRGWSAAHVHVAFARAVGLEPGTD